MNERYSTAHPRKVSEAFRGGENMKGVLLRRGGFSFHGQIFEKRKIKYLRVMGLYAWWKGFPKPF
jgi:hypothetical protein